MSIMVAATAFRCGPYPAFLVTKREDEEELRRGEGQELVGVALVHCKK